MIDVLEAFVENENILLEILKLNQKKWVKN